MISNPIRRYGAAILMLLTCIFSGSVLATTHTATKSHKAPTVKKISSTKVSSKQEYSRNSVKSSSLPDLRKYPSGTPRKKAFLRTVMPYITKQNQAITADRNWLVSKQYDARWSPSEKARLKDIATRYKVKWSGNTRHVPWNALLERVDIIPNSMVATMAAAESGWGTSRLARENNNLFGMKCGAGRCRGGPGQWYVRGRAGRYGHHAPRRYGCPACRRGVGRTLCLHQRLHARMRSRYACDGAAWCGSFA